MLSQMLLSFPPVSFPSKIPTRIHSSLSQTSTTRISKPKPDPKPKPKSKPQTLPKSAIQRISEKLRTLGFVEPDPPPSSPLSGPGSAGEIFIPTPREIPRYRVGHTIDTSWSTPDNPVPDPGTGATTRLGNLWKEEREREEKERRRRMEELPMAAELVLEREELKRLRGIGIRLDKRLKVGKAGITEGIVNGIHERWRRSELVKIKCEDLCRMNMKRTHEILERKTGGLVVWRSGSIIVLYRGANYKYPYFAGSGQTDCTVDNISDESDSDESFTGQDGDTMSMFRENTSGRSPNTSKQQADSTLLTSRSTMVKSTNTSSLTSLVAGVGSPNKFRLQLPGEAQLGEEADRLLDGLGPRFTDWWGYEPLPVDADLLPGFVPGFRTPFRLLPFGIKPKLTDREMTILRRLSRHLPCHFALGKNRNLQGLALSIVRLWEKCEVAKIAVKRGVQNTNSELMVEELKKLTGGTLLSRDREFIVFYRGKDFLPPAVSSAIEERRYSEISKFKQNTEAIFSHDKASSQSSFGRRASADDVEKETYCENLPIKGRKKPIDAAIKRVETKLSLTLQKKENAEKLLAELEKPVGPLIVEYDKEGITEEERYMLRKVGLRMKPFLLLGRRGVFAGTVENMHLHWKYRELVKIICKDRCIEQAELAARTLETESGGILVAVERVNKGYAIIVYRGKNYRRPPILRPKTLLEKKEAMKRSLEAQRYESLKLHVLSLSRNIEKLEDQMKDQSALDMPHLTAYEASDTASEISQKDGSVERDETSSESAYHNENVKEVNEADAESLYQPTHVPVPRDAETTTLPNNDNSIASSGEDGFLKDEGLISFSQLPKINIPGSQADSSDDREFRHASFLEDQVPDFTTSSLSSEVAKELSNRTPRKKSNSSLQKYELKDESDHDILFRAAPLSNRERLMLRKQALRMKKRPVLAVGRNNVVSGVARTIRTHFKKHPLAIVNIKGRAEGTSAQEVIFELEQATGAVLVSREPNKVILYRGWGEGEFPGGDLKKDVRNGSTSTDEEKIVSSELMEAIGLECGLSYQPDK